MTGVQFGVKVGRRERRMSETEQERKPSTASIKTSVTAPYRPVTGVVGIFRKWWELPFWIKSTGYSRIAAAGIEIVNRSKRRSAAAKIRNDRLKPRRHCTWNLKFEQTAWPVPVKGRRMCTTSLNDWSTIWGQSGQKRAADERDGAGEKAQHSFDQKSTALGNFLRPVTGVVGIFRKWWELPFWIKSTGYSRIAAAGIEIVNRSKRRSAAAKIRNDRLKPRRHCTWNLKFEQTAWPVPVKGRRMCTTSLNDWSTIWGQSGQKRAADERDGAGEKAQHSFDQKSTALGNFLSISNCPVHPYTRTPIPPIPALTVARFKARSFRLAGFKFESENSLM
ncbi:hypothetical protein C8R47DRAFT_1192293 [Mycena vitilis]|nr:hypothetical protein C8R47DRAFT_1192293 [Mycena vitilis]